MRPFRRFAFPLLQTIFIPFDFLFVLSFRLHQDPLFVETFFWPLSLVSFIVNSLLRFFLRGAADSVLFLHEFVGSLAQ